MIHFLHGIIWGTEDVPGTAVGKYVIHYAHGADEERPIILGADGLDWWARPPWWANLPESSGARTLNLATIAWSGQNPKSRARASGENIHLYKTTWANPRPDAEVASIDFVSTRKSAAPFLVAITAE